MIDEVRESFVASVTLTDREIWVRDLVGTRSMLAGRALAGSVESVTGDLGAGRLVARVVVGGETFEVEARPGPGGDLMPGGVDGWCTCGLAAPCRHTVAALLACGGPQPATGPAAPDPAPAALPGPAAWETALSAALAEPTAAPPAAGPAANRAKGQPVALQFELTADPRRRIAVRIVGPGQNGGWVRSGGVSWAWLRYGDHYVRHLPPPQVRLLRELHSLPSTASGFADRVLVLDAIPSRRVWDLLQEAQEVGLPLVTSGRHAEPVRVHPEPAGPRVDVRRERGELVVRAVLHLPGHGDVRQSSGFGDPQHGVAWTTAEPGSGLNLARYVATRSPLLDRLDAGGPIHVPGADEERFLAEYLPLLAARADVVSLDRSVSLPAPQPPILVLQVAGHGGHQVELSWSWAYPLGGTRRAEPLLPPGTSPADAPAGRRDAAAEARTLDAVAPLLAGTPGLLEPGPGGPQPVAAARLDGVSTARFMAETVPLLHTVPGVEVDVTTGPQLPEYREVDAVPVVRFDADDDPAGSGGPAGSGPGQEDWFDLAVTVTVDGHRVPFEQLFVALAQGHDQLVLDNGVYFDLDRPQFEQLRRLIVESRDLLDAPPGTVRLGRYHAGLWGDVEQLGQVHGARAEQWRRTVQTLTAAGEGSLPEHPVPAGLQATLRPYQEAGFGWLATLHALQLGGVLADDMGLGKTVQALALVLHTREQHLTDLPFLVVAPTSVVGNWAAEAARFAPGLRVVTVTQTAARRGHDLAEAVAGADLVVTSYTLFRLEFEQYRAREWAGLLLDEAQNVKNHASAGFRCAKELPAAFKLAITGTPMENNLMELWALLSITAPGLFARADRFTEHYRHPIEREHDAEQLAQLRRRIRPLLLRRTKDQVARDLPDRQEQVVDLDLHPRQRTLYAKYLQRERQKVLGLLGDLNRNRFEVFRSLTLLRQAALDISLVDPAHQGVPSTKLDALAEHLDGIVAEGHRVLVFSQFTRFLGLARDRIENAGIDYCYLDGTTRNRAKVIARFRNGEAPVFLISLKAGGAGLNLTEADYVILLDPWWNPATEAQAVDRAHRIGQTRKVMVYRLVAKDTIEEKVMALKERKAALTASVLHGDGFTSSALTADDIRGLLS